MSKIKINTIHTNEGSTSVNKEKKPAVKPAVKPAEKKAWSKKK